MPKWKTVCRWDADNRIYRVGRIVWPHAKLSLALSPRLFKLRREYGQFMVTVIGIRVQFTSGGGVYV